MLKEKRAVSLLLARHSPCHILSYSYLYFSSCCSSQRFPTTSQGKHRTNRPRVLTRDCIGTLFLQLTRQLLRLRRLPADKSSISSRVDTELSQHHNLDRTSRCSSLDSERDNNVPWRRGLGYGATRGIQRFAPELAYDDLQRLEMSWRCWFFAAAILLQYVLLFELSRFCSP